MATYNKFQDFVEQLGKGVHQLHAAGHQLDCYLSNATPSASLDAVKADLAEITNQNGYSAPEDVANDFTETGGTGTLTGTDITITASGGSFGPFQYVVMDNDTPTSPADPLIAWWDYGSALTVNNGESFTIDFGASIATIA
jgi:hypothetical protein